VDYYLRRTPAFWNVRRALAPVHVVLAQEGGEVVAFGVNETAQPVTAGLRYGVFDLAGGFPLDSRKDVTLAPNASSRLASFPAGAWKDPHASLAFAILERDGRVLARNRLVLPLFKELKWPRAEVRVRAGNGRAVFESPTFAWGVCLDLDGETPLADNFFDVYPGIPHAIEWRQAQPPAVLHVGNLT
jgi:beta-mannosidase